MHEQGQEECAIAMRPSVLQRMWQRARLQRMSLGAVTRGLGKGPQRVLRRLSEPVKASAQRMRETARRYGRRSFYQERTVTVMRPAAQLDTLLRDPTVLQRVMGPFIKLSVDGTRMHWSLRLPSGHALEWDTEQLEHRPGELLSWQALPDAALAHRGQLLMRAVLGGRGTELTLQVGMELKRLPLADGAQPLLDHMQEMAAVKVLRRFKSLAEASEPRATTQGSASRGGASAPSAIRDAA